MRGVLGRAVILACGAALAACTFPDVEYAGAGGAAGASSATGDPCSQLEGCTAAATSCANVAMEMHDACVQRCKNDPMCVAGCDQELNDAREGCATTCEHCGAGCSTEAPACQASAGL
jgi:hypothetical protein